MSVISLKASIEASLNASPQIKKFDEAKTEYKKSLVRFIQNDGLAFSLQVSMLRAFSSEAYQWLNKKTEKVFSQALESYSFQAQSSQDPYSLVITAGKKLWEARQELGNSFQIYQTAKKVLKTLSQQKDVPNPIEEETKKSCSKCSPKEQKKSCSICSTSGDIEDL